MKYTMTLMALSLSAAIFTGCGGKNEVKTETVTTATAFYIDSAVSGINYICGGQEGVTGPDGSFTFEVGSGCTFFLGDIPLRAVDSSLLKDGGNFYETDITIARVLQSIDADGNPDNGISISEDIVAALANEGITSLPTNEEELDVMLATIAANGGTEVSAEAAQAHLNASAGIEEKEAPETKKPETEKPATPTETPTTLENLIVGNTFYAIGQDETSVSTLVFNADGSATFFGITGSYSIDSNGLTINDPSSQEGPFVLENYQELSDAIHFSDNTGNETGIFYLTEEAALNRLNLPTTAAQAKEMILGTWQSPCSIDIDYSTQETYTFKNDGNVTIHANTYSDTQCTTYSNSFTYDEQYSIGEKRLDSSGRIAYEINYHFDVAFAYGLIAFKVNGLYQSQLRYIDYATPESRTKDIDRTQFIPKL